MTTSRRRTTRRADLAHIEELLIRLMVLRRQPSYRHLLAESTGLAGRLATMRLLRVVDGLLKEGNKPPSLSEVAERMGIEQSNASRTVDYAVERGLIVKGQAEDDGRRLELTLTTTGTSVIDELDTRRDKVHKGMFRDWSDDEVETLTSLLEKLCGSYDEIV